MSMTFKTNLLPPVNNITNTTIYTLGDSDQKWKIYGNVEGTATALTTNAGGALAPVYFSGGIPVQCTMTGASFWGALPWINKTTGVIDIGKTLNFHASETAATGAQIIYNSTDNCIDFIFA